MGIDDLLDKFHFSTEIRHQDFDQQIRVAPLDGTDAACNVGCPLVLEFVSVHCGQDDIT